jgi:hypothetical protein
VNRADGYGKIVPANPSPCSECPWRTVNQGKPHPHGWYTKKNLARLWAALRRGESMSCHPTDVDNIVPEGGRVVPPGTEAHECAGALLLQQRELMYFQQPCAPFDRYQSYRRDHPRGLSKMGVFRLAERAMFGGVPLIGGMKMTKLDLNQEVSYPPLGVWKPEELKAV